MHSLCRPLALCALLALPIAASAQTVAFGGIRTDASAPVEVTADSLSVNQTDGSAVFTGNVVIIQGQMRLAAAEVRVDYAEGDQTRIERLHATGGVTLVSATEAAEAREAVYSIDAGNVVLTGDVVLTQGSNVLSGQKLTVDLKSGTGSMEGRVRTLLQPGGN
ncbi:lipopolysaccharide transport periplasmic protein LptA [Rhodobacter veldkampii DSM 11550]|uniref:Lipopolysaccharide transport periplasmic protein LptA n=1 Tax=Phaeovulum veldkampii DSM 11550 TaxID=1185920 RepID=A0A2T4JGW6_9RHOB|nr:lipopolysaccharide transport periplasmic protein LptA [Phaeovulum veldkampii]MBK5945022.1 lipopolysaccharide transport periplasmic protein LptA [Phaeovulum veldkampii DSM 11550]NCU19315.1 lipopolysaccharide transport periplasmic protein LptA [Candidatus Falkowbacteria bacterium]PTE17155.1 lipopolysaccharide transport periplasmic protein LptA [Phaeovulum veldkampii DSM 11550]TDQ56162.1 lipopolysaccharide export system protein LptA [Phaeovulum veldkampii DSM 11550]